MLGLTICLLGALDVVLTRYGLARGLIIEGNPLLAALLARSPAAATAAAIVIPTAAVLFICALDRHHPPARPALPPSPWPRRSLYGLLAVRLAVTAMHAGWLLAAALAATL